MPYVGLQFDKAVILFEDEYTNSYGQAIGSRSTTARLTGVVYGGTQGGTYSFELSDGDRLVKIGESETFGVTNIAPNQSHAFWVDYRSAKRSDIKDDISATLTFHPNGDYGDVSAVAHLTSVEVSTYVHNSWIPHTSRKELGVGERSNIIIEPTDGIDGIMVTGCIYTNLTWQYRATGEHLSENISVSCSGVDFPVAFQTVLPQSIEAKCVFCDTNTIRNVAGNFVGHFDLAVLPTNVSFQALLIAELGFVSTNAVGFFALSSQSDLLDHSIHGGNTWHGIGAGNVFYDMVAFKAIYPPWGEGGSFTWPIENAWRIRFDSPVTNLVPWNASYDQRFELDADGTTRIMKFWYSLQQATNLEFQVTREAR